jgi:glycosyltransferase involved in cell wall biosynthesis
LEVTRQQLVSVVIPTYNRQNLVCRAVKSVLAQTYQNLECIVVDDCSTDGTLDALTELSYQDDRLRVVSHLQNRHASAARNTGITAARGELIAFLDDDDTWLPDKLEKQVKHLYEAPAEVGMIYCWFDIYRDQEIVGTRRPKLRGYIFDELLTSQPLGNASTLLVRREVIDKIGGFDENLPRGNDGDFIRRVGQYYEIEVVPEVLVHYFVDHDGNPRITGTDRKSLLDGVKSHEIKLQKFSVELNSKPYLKSALLSEISLFYAKLGMMNDCIENFGLAMKIQPFYRKVYMNAIKSIIIMILWSFLSKKNNKN